MHITVNHAQYALCYMFTVILANCIPEMTADMKRYAAHEVTILAKQKVVMETNPAYEQVRVN